MQVFSLPSLRTVPTGTWWVLGRGARSPFTAALQQGNWWPQQPEAEPFAVPLWIGPGASQRPTDLPSVAQLVGTGQEMDAGYTASTMLWRSGMSLCWRRSADTPGHCGGGLEDGMPSLW